MKLCDYGCGREAKHYLTFKTVENKWCCESFYNSCPKIRQQNRERHEGKTHTEKTKKKIGQGNKGKTQTEKAKNKIGQENKYSIEKIQEKYKIFSKEEDMRYNPYKPEKEIQVHCYNHNCPNSKEKDGWFTPTKNQFYLRKNALEKEDGNNGCYFYCLEECKQTCPSYNKKVSQLIEEDEIRAGIIKEETSGEELQIFREEVLRRQKEELGYNECQYCENQNLEELVVHHEYPRKTHPQFELDPDNGIVCCGLNSENKCHLKYGHRTVTPCSTGNLANKIC